LIYCFSSEIITQTNSERFYHCSHKTQFLRLKGSRKMRYLKLYSERPKVRQEKHADQWSLKSDKFRSLQNVNFLTAANGKRSCDAFQNWGAERPLHAQTIVRIIQIVWKNKGLLSRLLRTVSQMDIRDWHYRSIWSYTLSIIHLESLGSDRYLGHIMAHDICRSHEWTQNISILWPGWGYGWDADWLPCE
jgi:hypothetical protein